MVEAAVHHARVVKIRFEMLAVLFIVDIVVAAGALYGINGWKYAVGLAAVLTWRYAIWLNRTIATAKRRGERVPLWLNILSWALLAIAFIALVALIIASFVDPEMIP